MIIAVMVEFTVYVNGQPVTVDVGDKTLICDLTCQLEEKKCVLP